MPRGFFGNLIFAIIARMLCGNHLKHLRILKRLLEIDKISEKSPLAIKNGKEFNETNYRIEVLRRAIPRGGGGGTSLYGLYRYVPRNRVWFLEVLDP